MRICATCQYLLMLPSYPPKYKCELSKETVDYHHKCGLDIIPVVRCKDCRWREQEQPGMVYCPNVMGNWVEDDWFCADGERREE